jgi:hypothetical protein
VSAQARPRMRSHCQVGRRVQPGRRSANAWPRSDAPVAGPSAVLPAVWAVRTRRYRAGRRTDWSRRRGTCTELPASSARAPAGCSRRQLSWRLRAVGHRAAIRDGDGRPLGRSFDCDARGRCHPFRWPCASPASGGGGSWQSRPVQIRPSGSSLLSPPHAGSPSMQRFGVPAELTRSAIPHDLKHQAGNRCRGTS